MWPANKGRVGTIMVTPPKLLAKDSLSPLMRTVAISSGLLAFGLVVRINYPKRVLYDAVEAAELDDRAETLGKRPVSGPARSL